MKHILFFVLMSLACTVHALNVSDPRRFVCKQGNCMNGQGRAWDAALSVSIQGNWSGGNTIPGETYVVTLPIAPTLQFKQVYGHDGLLESGDQPRSLATGSANIPFFSGSYERIEHTFMRQRVAVIKDGVYNNGTGIEFRGRFGYLPAKSGMNTGWGSGYYIFFGDKVDTEENEQETGLFVSDETMGGAPVRFVKADPSYLAHMHQKYQSDMNLAQADFKKQESEQTWRNVLGTITNVMLAVASGGGNLQGGGSNSLLTNMVTKSISGQRTGSSSVTGEIAMNLVSEIFNSKSSGETDVKSLAIRVIGKTAGGNNQLKTALIQAVSENLDSSKTNTQPGTGTK